MTDAIVTENRDAILRIEMRRPERKNALTQAMYSALAAALDQGEADASVRAMLIHGQPGMFTAGNDVKDFLENPKKDLDAPVFQFLRRLIRARKPIVAAVSGNAVGVGTTMLLHCDYVVADESARFAVPFTSLGVCPEAASSVSLALVIGWRRASEMLMLGQPVDAATALDWGLVNRVVPAAELAAAAATQARAFAAQPVQAMRATKALLRDRLLPIYEKALADEAGEFGRLLQTPDSQEAFRAFLEKRAPKFE
ncbi:enoyl-CoA hydratase [Usitatibacter palustris]|uniref:Putative enoyl-CoA hydratase n=1 Tax=Usitatibacter palustris TaxID=2732487 RepID=A0A6M4H2X8_9PROT|nr:enoyl-CoA hydratase [Usitatibacter palustris]QJR13931.1 putative enoyl-CoA hydratase [Usitatibacter palustris]